MPVCVLAGEYWPGKSGDGSGFGGGTSGVGSGDVGGGGNSANDQWQVSGIGQSFCFLKKKP